MLFRFMLGCNLLVLGVRVVDMVMLGSGVFRLFCLLYICICVCIGVRKWVLLGVIWLVNVMWICVLV